MEHAQLEIFNLLLIFIDKYNINLLFYIDVRKRKTLSEIILEEIESEGMVDMVQKYDRWLKIQEQ